jgi:CheY-like chemotaxis protein
VEEKGKVMALIVVADDEFMLATLLADILEDEGHEVEIASHGIEALEQIHVRRPALLITDFMMPLMTGLELAQAIRADEDLSDLPIILVSGAQAAIARQFNSLFSAVMDKPYERVALVEAVERALSTHS